MNIKKVNLAIFASGNGTNAEAIMDHFKDDLTISVALVLSNNPNAGVLARAHRFGVPTIVFNREQFHGDVIVDKLKNIHVTHVVLAGFLWLVPENIIRAFSHRIINIHPSLLPKFGGKGMYGEYVHQAVVAAREMQTGITIHEVDTRFDEGKIIFQASCPVAPTDSAATIAAKVHALEYAHFPRVIAQWASGLAVA